MKQRHIQSFLMVSAAFFAMNAPIRPGSADTVVQRAAQIRTVAGGTEQTAQRLSKSDKSTG
jgi:hypothetical protein